MKPEKSEAIILQTHPARDRDKLVVFLTPEHGKRKGWAYGARSLRNRFGAALEPLSKVELTWMEKETEEVVRIESAVLIRSLFPAQQKLVPSMAATYLAEQIDTFAQAGEESELFYRLLDRTTAALLAGLPPVRVITYFELWILRLAGTFPSIKECAGCHGPIDGPLRYEEEEGVFLCRNCGEDLAPVIPNDIRDALVALFRMPVEEFGAATVADSVLFELRALARQIRRNFLGHELKSHDLLQGLLAKG